MEVIRRRSCRALLVTPEREILLVKIDNPEGFWVGWITPGGGVEQGESEETALRRELFEEVGLENFEMGPCVWRRFHSFPWKGKVVEQHEDFFLLEVKKFSPVSRMDPKESEMLDFCEMRWWKIAEIPKAKEQMAPRHLFQYLQRLEREGIPSRPWDVGV